MAFRGRGRDDGHSDVESEHEALRRQRLEAAAELETLKRSLAERVAQVQARERELADAIAKAERADGKGASRLEAVRLRLAEAKEARASLDARKSELDARAGELDVRERSLAQREQAVAEAAAQLANGARVEPTQIPDVPETSAVDARAAALDAREQALNARQAQLDALAAELAARADDPPTAESVEPAHAPSAGDLEAIEAKLAELREAEQLFARTRHELATRSDALTEREAALDARERALAARESPASPPDLDALEARIRRLEGGGRAEAPTFSAGLRSLQERGLRGGSRPDEPLH